MEKNENNRCTPEAEKHTAETIRKLEERISFYEDLLIKTEEYGEFYRSIFHLRISGINRSYLESSTHARKAEGWFNALSNNDEIEIITRTESSALRLLIKGASNERSENKSRDAAIKLYQNVSDILHFEYPEVIVHNEKSIVTNSECTIGINREVIVPGSLVIKSKSGMGFTNKQNEDGEEELILISKAGNHCVESKARITESPTSKQENSRASFLDNIIELSGGYLEWTIKISPITLEESEQSLLRNVLSGTYGLYDENDDQYHHIADQEKCINNQLEKWNSQAQGLNIELSLASNQPLSNYLVQKFGAYWFGSQDFVSKDDSDMVASVDLRNKIHISSTIPSLLPSVSAMKQSGIHVSYHDIPKGLPRDGIQLGHIKKRSGKVFNVFLKEEDLSRHCLCLGATGTGKSTLFLSIMEQILERCDEGLCLIDPHGDLYNQVLKVIPEDRVDDVMVVDFSDREQVVGLNLLECSESNRRLDASYNSNEMMSIFDRLYDMKKSGGPMFETYMRNALILVSDNKIPGGNLADIPKVFEEESFRKKMLENCLNDEVISFWKKQAEAAGGETALANMAPYVTSKINQFTSNPIIRAVVGQEKSSIDFKWCMDNKKIVLINLSKGHLSDLDSRLIGMLLLGLIYKAAMKRSSLPADQRVPYRVFIDEAHNFATDTLSSVMAETRKYGLQFVLATQTLSQFRYSEGGMLLLESILGNVGTVLAMRVGATDADLLSEYMDPLKKQDLEFLQSRMVAARMQVAGNIISPFVFKTAEYDYDKLSTLTNESKNKIMDNRKNYTSKLDTVEELIRHRNNRISFKNTEKDEANS